MTTTPARKPQHCNHERICYLYRDATIGKKNKHRCTISPCSNDTRATHTSPPAPTADTVTMPRWVFEFLTRKPVYTDYIVASKDEEAKRIIESLRAKQQEQPKEQHGDRGERR